MPLWGWLALAVLVLAVLTLAGGLLAARSATVRLFIERIEALGWLRTLQGVWGLARDPRVPWFVRVAPVPLLLYLAMPFDLVPDFLPVVGQLDDVMVVGAVLWLVLRFTPREVFDAHFPPPGGSGRRHERRI